MLHAEFREETLKPVINPEVPGILSTNSGIPGGDAETRDNLVYLALIPGYREETLKPGIIPGNPVYLAGTVWCTGHLWALQVAGLVPRVRDGMGASSPEEVRQGSRDI